MIKDNSSHVKGLVDGLLQKIEKGSAKKANAVNEAWSVSVDDQTKGYSRPISLKKGILLVLVDSSTWLYKLTIEKEKIKKVFNENYIGRIKVKDIRFRIGKIEI